MLRRRRENRQELNEADMNSQKLIKVLILTSLTIFLYLFTKVLLFSSQSYLEPDDVTEVKVQRRFTRYGFVFPSSFNRSCTSEFLDLPPTLVKHCTSASAAATPGDPTSPCALFTCRNLISDYGLPQLHEVLQ